MSFPLCTYLASISLPTGVFYQTDKAGLRQSLIARPGENAAVDSSPDELDAHDLGYTSSILWQL